MSVTSAAFALFFDVSDLTAGGDFAVAADNAAAGQRGKPEKSNQTHDVVQWMK